MHHNFKYDIIKKTNNLNFHFFHSSKITQNGFKFEIDEKTAQ